MLKKLLASALALCAAVAFAAVDANKATQAELESIKGIGPAISGKILDERKKGAFKDWNDMIERVKGVGEGNAAKFSAEGLTVNGATFKGVAASPAAAKKDDKAAAKTEDKKATAAAPAPATATPATATTAAPAAAAAKADTKKGAAAMSADDKKAEKAKAKAEKKAAAEKAKQEKAQAKEAKAAAAKASEPKSK
jgi:competence protein ComEA